MNNLQMNSFGVQELNAEEMMNVEGGGFGPFGVGFRVWFHLPVWNQYHELQLA